MIHTRIVSVVLFALTCLAATCLNAEAQPARGKGAAAVARPAEQPESPLAAGTFAGLTLRSIGPALTSGRISDLAVDPARNSVWYVAVASGGVWKTVNAGTTWTPIFDDQGSYSIGCVTLDPRNPQVVWVGTGENNSQRSVGYGDGVYKSLDGGKSWQRMGLAAAEHIAKILVDPRDSQVVYVAAQGPLWSAGGDRGLYKTTDGGATWTAVLAPSEHTGVTDVVLDPRDPDVLYAASYQRRRHVWTIVNGGPESAIHKSTDGGKTWRKLSSGLPKAEMGRIGLALAPADPDVLYAVIEARDGAGGFFRSTDRGESWEKRSGYVSPGAQYYHELFADPRDVDRVYAIDTYLQVTEDGGKTFRAMPYTARHVDVHVLWLDPDDPQHLIEGNDGGLYQSFDGGATWAFVANLPVTQFYKVAVDNAAPFYHVHGGTQDNFALGGPSRTASAHGITNGDWFVTVFGDGFQPRVDPDNPDIIYSQWQYGELVRFDRKSGEEHGLQPQPGPGDAPLRWNWDSPLILSPHRSTRLYFAANRLFRSDDRGDHWTAVSPDLTRQLDRNQLPVMGKLWSVDAVARHISTSAYGNIVALSESPLAEGLLYAGTDDGLVQVSEDGGGSWRRQESFPGVPDMTYVNRLEASLHDPNVVYAAFNNHKRGDFKPYLLKSSDRGRSWTSIAGDLPERGSVYSLVQDHVRPELLFAGTEFGVYFTVDEGRRWIELTGGMPTIAVRDLAIQQRENDLVVATFGRGFYVLDDYSPLRAVSEESLAGEALLFPVRAAWMYHPSREFGLPGKSFLGDNFFTAANPPFGAVFTYYLKEAPKTRKQQRHEAEAKLAKEGGTIPIPSWQELTAEAREPDPLVVLTVRDEDGEIVRQLTAPAAAGVQRLAWDLRYPPANPVNLQPSLGPLDEPPRGPLAVPGTYRVELGLQANGELRPLAGPQSFSAVALGNATLPAADRPALVAFQRQTARLQRAVLGAGAAAREAQNRLNHLRQAVLDTPGIDPQLSQRVWDLEQRLKDLQVELTGDPVKARYQETTLPAITDRVAELVDGHWRSTSAPTATHREDYRIAAEAFAGLLPRLQQLIERDLGALEAELEAAGAPWTPGRVPRWQPE